MVTLSGAFLAAGLLLRWFNAGPEVAQTILFGLSTLAGGALILPVALSALRRLRFDMNVLMVVAVSGAWLINEGAEGAAVVFLFALSELLESWSVGRARRAIASC